MLNAESPGNLGPTIVVGLGINVLPLAALYVRPGCSESSAEY